MIQEIIEAIDRNNLSGKCIYRGVKSIDGDFTLKKVRLDRKPMNTDSYISKKIDELFYKKFHKKLRSETVFGVKDFHSASDYGTPCILVPKDKPTYYFNNDITDLYFFTRRIISSHGEDYLLSKLNDIVDSYSKSDSIGLIDSDVEIMIDCKEYYLIDTSNLEEKDLTYESLKKLLLPLAEDTTSGDIAGVDLPLGDIKNNIITRIKKIKNKNKNKYFINRNKDE